MTTATQKPSANGEDPFAESYQRLLPEYEALPVDAQDSVRLDVAAAVSTVLGVIAELSRYRDEIVRRLSDFDIARFDKIEDYAMGLSYANAVYAKTIAPTGDLKEMYVEGLGLHEMLNRDLTALIGRGLMDTSTLERLRGPNVYKNLATSLQIQALALKDSWSTIEGNSATQPREIDRAFRVAARMLRAVGLREQNHANVVAAADMRTRAFTLFIRAYDDARRAVIYLRWHEGDADAIAPSLYANGSNGGK
jgi:hypothetical protein